MLLRQEWKGKLYYGAVSNKYPLLVCIPGFRSNERWSKLEDARLISWYDSGLLAFDLARLHQRSANSVCARLKKLRRLNFDRDAYAFFRTGYTKPYNWSWQHDVC